MTMQSSEQPLGNLGSSTLNPAMLEKYLKGEDQKLVEIARWVNEQYNTIKNARSHIERQWYLNLAFYFGKQNVVYRGSPNMMVGSSGSLFVPPAPYYRVRTVINRIRPMIRVELAKLTSQKPSAYVIPASSEDRDMFAAQAGEQIWESIYRRKRISTVLRRTLFWTLICGTGFMKASWNPKLIDRDSDQMGDFEFYPETPFHIFVPDFRTEELEEQPFLIHAKLMTRDQLELMFPGSNFQKTEKSGGALLDDSWLNMVGAQSLSDKKSVLVLECWVKPGMVKMFPNGAMYTVIGEAVVQGGEGWPYKHQQFPFAKFDHIPSGKFYADSTIVDLIPPQREYNRTRSQIIEAKNKMAKPALIAPRGSVDPAKITSEPGQVILYQPGFDPPQPLPLQSLPSYVLQEVDRILMDMADISGQHEISKGMVPPGVTAATAISYLQEQDESRLSHSFASVESGVEKVAAMTLAYVSEFWDTERTVRLVGQDGSFDALTFKGSDLRSNQDIRVEGGSALPNSRAARQAFLMDLMKMGFIDPNKGLEVMEIGGLGKLYEHIQTDIRQAQRENVKMAGISQDLLDQFGQAQQMDIQQNPQNYFDPVTSEPKAPTLVSPLGEVRFPLIVPVNTWDEHRMHIEIHNKYRKSQAFENLPPEAKALFEEHVRYHVEQIVVGQMAAAPAGVMTGDANPAGMQQQDAMAQDPNAPQGADTGMPPMPPMGGSSNGGSVLNAAPGQ